MWARMKKKKKKREVSHQRESVELVAASLFVCVCRVQWSHQEASSVCEAILSQRIPSPICKHTPSLLPLPFRRSEHPPLWIPRNLICHRSAKKKKKQPKKTFPSYYLSLKMFHSLPLLPSWKSLVLTQQVTTRLASCWPQPDLLWVSISPSYLQPWYC